MAEALKPIQAFHIVVSRVMMGETSLSLAWSAASARMEFGAAKRVHEMNKAEQEDDGCARCGEVERPDARVSSATRAQPGAARSRRTSNGLSRPAPTGS
jgi:hypothetical protein